MDRELDRIALDYAEHAAASCPERATAEGDHRFDDRLSDLGEAGRQSERAAIDALRARLEALGDDATTDRLSREVLLAKLDEERAATGTPLHLFLLDPLDGPHRAFLELIDEDHPRRDRRDGEALLARLRALPKQLGDHGDNLRAGLHAGQVAPRPLAERVLDQLERAVTGGCARVIGAATDEIEANAHLRGDPLIAELRAAVEREVLPAYAALRDLVRDRLLPAALPADRPGLCAVDGGEAAYRALCRAHTTTELDPAALASLGEQEVAAALEAQREAARALGHRDPAAARAALAANRSDGDPIDPAREFLARAAPLLGRAFARLPAHPLVVSAVPPSLGADSPAAWYVAPSDGDDATPGKFHVNLHAGARPPPHQLEVLTAHEALPGHHLQLCHALEQRDLPPFRRRVEFTAYVEGWGLYAEQLADGLDLYRPEARFALAEQRTWRAARLCVDTGLHAFGWSFDRARKFLAAHAPLDDAQVRSEIERYLADPGQALAYTVGLRAFTRLRDESSARLGAAFSLPLFHAHVLDPGALPLGALARHVAAWDGS